MESQDSLIGEQLNNWLILDKIDSRHYLCQCQCKFKTVKKVAKYSLTSGRSKSCGKCNMAILNIGDMFGNWEVLSDVDSDYKVLCQCHCGYCDGKTKKVLSYDLIDGRSTGCGKDRNKDKLLNIVKKQFGNWVVLEYKGSGICKCECQCVNKTIKYISVYNLVNGLTKSCGCSKKNSHKLIDLSNEEFGDLRVVRYYGGNKWICECKNCKNVELHFSHNLRRSKSFRCNNCNNVKLSKEEVIKKINDYISINSEKPFRYDLCEILDRGLTTVNRYINEYNLYDYLNTSFRSRQERELSQLFPNFTMLNYRGKLDGLELDMYDPINKIAIEFNGTYWHSDIFKDKKYHQNKTIECAKQGIRIIHIFEYEWNDVNKKSKLIEFINWQIKKETSIKIYGRDTVIKEVSINEANEFEELYHIQGKATSEINVGCFYKCKLVGLMTFGKSRFNYNYEYEIIRSCWISNTHVIGGIEKIFKYFINNYNPQSILTYVDISKFTGNSYLKIGFKPIDPNPITEPNYVWANAYNEILTRYQTQKHKLIKQGLGTEDQTEDEIMKNIGFYKIYDSGNLKLEWLK